MPAIRAVLFDLDGTLVDTAPDLVYALNRLRIQHNLPELALQEIRPIANLGSKAMIKRAFDMDENHADFNQLREAFLALYEKHVDNAATLFPRMNQVLDHLDNAHIPWGIVTNKLTRHATPLLKALHLYQRTGCLVCGDSLPASKPHPLPLLHACQLLKQAPAQCLYIGDAATDVIASKAAGIKSLVALYGYIQTTEDTTAWQADGYVQQPVDIIEWLAKYPENESL